MMGVGYSSVDNTMSSRGEIIVVKGSNTRGNVVKLEWSGWMECGVCSRCRISRSCSNFSGSGIVL